MNRLNQNDLLKTGSGQIVPGDPAFVPGMLTTPMNSRGSSRNMLPPAMKILLTPH
jgi:hypothetical protein